MTIAGERELRERELAALRARLALPPGAERDAALPAVFEAVALFNTEVEAARPLLLAALPSLGSRDAETQRALLTAAHTFYAADAAPLLWPVLPALTQSKPFAIAAYTLLQADPAAAARLAGRGVPAVSAVDRRSPVAGPRAAAAAGRARLDPRWPTCWPRRCARAIRPSIRCSGPAAR